MTDAGATGITQVGTVAIAVNDQEKALDFYVGKLGFEKRRDAAFGSGQRWVEVAPPGAATTVALTAAHEGDRAGRDTGIRFTTADAGADHERLRDRGVDTDPEVMRWPGVPPMFSLRDPDGNTLYIVENEA
jgi:catechol 2,3-dioxygenase-like lactoylglutathione lyase family enzyme